MRFPIFFSFLYLIILNSSATPSDSIKHKSRSLVVTPRFNTLNMAPVSGNIVNRHINIDLSMVYIRNQFMWTIVNGFDLEDNHSEMNYLLTNVRYRIDLTKKLSVSPFLAYYSEHAHQLFDPISDANGGMFFTFRQNQLTVEAFVLFVRLTHKSIEKDIINRSEIRYKINSIVFSGFVFQNTDHFDDRRRLAVGFKAVLPEYKLFNKVPVRSEATGSFRIQENPVTTNLSGVFLSLAFPLNI